MPEDVIPSADALKARLIRAKLAGAGASPAQSPVAGPAERDRGIANPPPQEGMLDRFGRGFKEGFGEGAPPGSGFVSAITQPARAAMAGLSGVTRGAQEAIAGTGRLGRDVAAIPEAFAGSPGSLAGAGGKIPKTPAVPASGINKERAMLAREARDVFNLPITAPQIGMSPTGKFADAATRSLPFSGAREHEMTLQQAFNREVAKTFGEDAPLITQSVMSDAKKRIGGEINRIENSNKVALDDHFLADLAAIEEGAHAGISDQEYAVVSRQLENALQHVTDKDDLEGLTYGKLLRKDAPLDRAVSNANPNIARPAQQIKEALQDALQRSLSDENLEAYRQARFQYKNMKAIEPLVNKNPQGDISPALLNSRVSQQFRNRAYDASGTNPLDRLGKIGQAFLKEPGTSGTTERREMLMRMGELGGAVAAGDVFGIGTTLAGTAGTLGAGRAVSSALRSPAMADRTIKRALDPGMKGNLLASGAAGAQQKAPLMLLMNEIAKKNGLQAADPHEGGQ